MLIPAIIARQPMLSLGVLPVFLAVDAAKCSFVAHVTTNIEEFEQLR